MIIQGVIFAWLFPRIASGSPGEWKQNAVVFFCVAGVLAWSFTTLPVAAKYRMTSISKFVLLETAFTIIQFAVVSPLLALVHRN